MLLLRGHSPETDPQPGCVLPSSRFPKMKTSENTPLDTPKQPVVENRMFDEFREIRKKVWFQATQGKPENQRKLRETVVELSDKANLDLWRTNEPKVRVELWEQFIAKIFYAGFEAATVNAALPDIYRTFRDYKTLCSPDWDVRLSGSRLSPASGRLVREYFEDGSQKKICHPMKIRKIVGIARFFTEYFEKHPEATALSLLMQGEDSDDVWLLSDNLAHIGLSGLLTQLHLMMDLGFDCIKPDIVISRLVLAMGWLAHFSEDLPADLQEADLRGKGKYGTRFHYTNSVVIKPIVNLARAFVSEMRRHRESLESDIGWVSRNLIREFDIFMVSYGQRPDPSAGIVMQLG
jgi:hypothetical protein